MTPREEQQDFSVSLRDMVACLSRAIDLVTSSVRNHHRVVACISAAIADEMRLPAEEKRNIVLAAALHDIGALSTREKLSTLEFEHSNPNGHADIGYLLLRNLPDLANAAFIVKHHHTAWADGRGAERNGAPVPLGSQIVFAADRAAVLIRPDQEILGQERRILETMTENEGRLFRSDVLAALRSAAAREAFWLDTGYLTMEDVLDSGLGSQSISLSLDGLLSLAELFREVIDYRTDFTAAHSTGVAVVAEKLASLSGFSANDSRKMRVAGLLHDLGKLAVPTEMLEKNAELTQEELYTIRQHPYYTYRLLEPMKALQEVRTWAALHHERLNGSGYPFRLRGSEIPRGARILAVADIFTALAEDRPYRTRMERPEILSILDRMADDGELDASVIATLDQHFQEVDSARETEQEPVFREYRRMLGKSMPH